MLNIQAASHLTLPAEKKKVVTGAGHLFEEPGALEQIAQLAGEWFRKQFRGK